MKRRAVSVAAAVLMAGAGTLALAAPAAAQPGSAAARGVVADLSAEVDGAMVIDADILVGSATAPPDEGTDTDLVVGVDVSALGVDLTAEVVEATATRGPDESSATATVADLGLDVLGTDVIAATAISAAATCPAIGPQTAETELTGLTVFGDAVVLEANTPPVVVTGDVTVAGLTDAELQISLTRVESVTDDGAVAAAVVADLLLTGDEQGVPVEIPVGTVILAEAICERPLPPAPTAIGITPDEGPQSGGQQVTITGTGFVPDETVVTFDGVPATDVEVAADGTSLTAVTPSGEVGPAEVVVTTPGGDTDPLAYTYLADGSDVVVDDLVPDTGPTAGGTVVTITGSGFTGATEVTFGGTPGTGFTVNDGGTVITVVTPPGSAGTVPVEILFPAGAVAAGDFTYVAPGAPVIDEVAPGIGPTSGGTTVIIQGSGFVPGATTVTICGVTIPADQVTVGADGSWLRFVTPPCPAGDTTITVTTPAGESAAAGFRYVAELPKTGSGLRPMLATGAGLIVLGATMLATLQRRRLAGLLA